MNLFKALEKGVKGVLQGVIMSIRTKKIGDSDKVLIQVGVPDLMINFETIVPEKFVPDCFEGQSVQFEPAIIIGKWSKPELRLSMVSVGENNIG